MPQVKKYNSNSERQKAYRERKKNSNQNVSNVTPNVTNNVTPVLKPTTKICELNFIRFEKILRKYKDESKDTKSLFNRILQTEKDKSITRKIFDFVNMYYYSESD